MSRIHLQNEQGVKREMKIEPEPEPKSKLLAPIFTEITENSSYGFNSSQGRKGKLRMMEQNKHMELQNIKQ